MNTEEKNDTIVEETAVEDTAQNDTSGEEEELSPWYYFFSQGCGWCKKATPLVEELNSSGDYPEILLLDTAEPDNAKLRDELFAEYKTQCGTPFFINADTGESICGFREKDIVEKWLNGESIPAPPRVAGVFPKVPFHGSEPEENGKWKIKYESWLKDNEHMPDDWQKNQKTADEILNSPRPKSDPPKLPPLASATNESLDKWGEEVKVWQEENKHLPNLQNVDTMVANFKQRINQQGGPAAAGGYNVPEVVAKVNSVEAKIQALEVKLDKVIAHFGVK